MAELYGAPILRIQYDTAFRILELEWHAPVSSSQLRQGMLEGLRLAQQQHPLVWISNLADMPIIRPLDQQWLYEEWFPQFAVLGVRRMAIVEAADMPHRLGVVQMMQHAEGLAPLATAYFPTRQAAHTWARQQRNELVLTSASAFQQGSRHS